MNYNKMVLFDWGGVLGDHCGTMYNEIEFFQKLGFQMSLFVPLKLIEERFTILKERMKYHSSLSTNSDKWGDESIAFILKTMYDLDSTYENISKFKSAFIILSSSVDCNKELVKYVHSLKDRCTIGLLSNCASIEKFKQDIDVQRSKFDKVYLSCDLGMRKPNKDIYDFVDDERYQILFIDDREENLTYPKELGWEVYHYTGNNEETIRVIETFINN